MHTEDNYYVKGSKHTSRSVVHFAATGKNNNGPTTTTTTTGGTRIGKRNSPERCHEVVGTRRWVESDRVSIGIEIERYDDDDEDSRENYDTERDWIVSKLHSYIHNLKQQKTTTHGSFSSSEISNSNNKEKKKVIHKEFGKPSNVKAARSLFHFLSNYSIQEGSSLYKNDEGDYDDLIGLLEQCVTQAIRRAGEAKDYKLILGLVDASIHFATTSTAADDDDDDSASSSSSDNSKKFPPLLTPRIFGEAIESLAQRTDANVAKIKSVWSKVAFIDQQQELQNMKFPSYLTGPPTAYELNMYLKALGTRGKMTACIEAFKQHTTPTPSTHPSSTTSSSSISIPIKIHPDAYTASLLFSLLTERISEDQKAVSDPSRPNDVGAHGSDVTSNVFSSKLRAILPWSTCWQWNVAIDIVDALQDQKQTRFQWNNHAYSSLLSLQSKAQDVFGHDGRGHNNGPQLTMAILDEMLQQNVKPDVVTCTLAMKSLGECVTENSGRGGGDHPVSLADSTSIKNNLAVDFLQKMKSDPRLPNPNTYTYTAAISACARHEDYVTAMKILEEMRSGTIHISSKIGDSGETNEFHSSSPPNTWTYNSVLASFGGPRRLNQYDATGVRSRQQRRKHQMKKKQQHIEQALMLLDQMKTDCSRYQLETSPDTVTYNTILGMGPVSSTPSNTSVEDSFVLSLIDEMTATGIARDEYTFRNSILSSASSSEVLKVIQRCLTDEGMLSDRSVTSILNTGLSTLSARRDFASFKAVLSQMKEINLQLNDETLVSLVQILSKCGHSSKLESLLIALGLAQSPSVEPDYSSEEIMQLIGLPLLSGSISSLFSVSDMRHLYTKTIESCLASRNFEEARRILSLMRENGHQPNFDCLQTFASAYAQSCLVNAPKFDHNEKYDDELIHAQNRASNAYKIIMAMNGQRPSIKVISKAVKACARTGEWDKARSLLKTLHNEVIRMKDDGAEWDLQTVQGIQATHGYILRQCEAQGNVTSALWFANNIQYFGKSMSQEREQFDQTITSSFPEYHFDHQEGLFLSTRNLTEVPEVAAQNWRWGMKFNDWISIIKTVSNAGYWRIAVTSLQQLRYYMESTKFDTVSEEDEDEMFNLLNQKYKQLVPAFVATVKCLEREGQYAWAVRVVSDWMEWSGRKPRADAVLSTIRALASNGLGDEIKVLLSRCTSNDLVYVPHKKGIRYEQMVYIGAMNALHMNGLYDAADEVYITAVTSSTLTFDLSSEDGQFVLDLHGLNVALAHSAVRVALRKNAAALESEEDEKKNKDMLIVTGRGKNSAFRLRPILRPQVQSMLTEEFYPSLNSLTVPGNTGCLVVPWQDIRAWQNYQQEQKGARMMELASLLAGGSRNRLGRLVSLMKTKSDDQKPDA